jgi:hypothetical protein
MAKQKNLKADTPIYHGAATFDGNLTLNIHGEQKTIRTDYGGIKLRDADPNKELIVLMRLHACYNELDTGYIVRTRKYDDCERPCFGLKASPDSQTWGVLNYCDVIAWGYADGGLNDSTLFYSCQSTVAEELSRERRRAAEGVKTHAEELAEMAELEEEEELDDIERCCVKLRVEGDDIQCSAHLPKDDVAVDPETRHAKGLLHDCAWNFDIFRKAHPEVTEIHYYTDDELLMEE